MAQDWFSSNAPDASQGGDWFSSNAPNPDLTSNPNREGVYQMQSQNGTTGVPYSKVPQATQQGYGFANDSTRFRYAKDSAADPNHTASFTPAAGDPRGTLEGQRQVERNASIPMQAVGGLAKSAAEMVPGFPREQTVALTPTQQGAKYAGIIALTAPGMRTRL
jgi:hypothetical protein